MAKNRIKFVNPLTRSLAEEMLGDVATLTLELNNQKLDMDRQLAAVREKYEAPVSELSERIKDKVAVLEAWATANPEEFPKNRKSIDFLHGVLGFRTGTPKLKTIKPWNWRSILKFIIDSKAVSWLRVITELDKERILSEYASRSLSAEMLRQYGMEVVQEESFFVEPNLQVLENKSVKEAA